LRQERITREPKGPELKGSLRPVLVTRSHYIRGDDVGPGVAVHTYNPSPQEDHKFKVSVGYLVRPCLKKKT
jgi:hypothetical protein